LLNKIGGVKGVCLSKWNDFYRSFVDVFDDGRWVDAIAYKSSGDFA
jgi:hypothetical protein